MQTNDFANFGSYPAIAKDVITNPFRFFREMPRGGGYVQPLLFMVILGVVSAFISMVLGLVGLGNGLGFSGLFLIPIILAVFGFVAAAVLFFIWKIMGSVESFEVAYRCLAYSAAITPITIALNAVPYLGGIIGILWSSYLLIVASTEVHHVKPKVAWVAFGGIAVLFAISSVSMELAARRMVGSLERYQQQSNAAQMQDLEKMSPEDAGKAVGEFLKGFGSSVDKK